MSRLALGILGSGQGTNCRAILERIREGSLNAEARVVVSDVVDAPILDIAREFSVPNVYMPPGTFALASSRTAKSNWCECCEKRESRWWSLLDSCAY